MVGKDPAGTIHPENAKLSLYNPWHGQQLLKLTEPLLKNVEVICQKEVAFNKFTKKVEFIPDSGPMPSHFDLITNVMLKNYAERGCDYPLHIMSKEAWCILTEYYASLKNKRY